MRAALVRAGLEPGDIDLVSTHATSTEIGDEREAIAVRQVFGDYRDVHVNNTKSFIGHAMGAAGVLELAGNFGSFTDGLVHPTINVEELDPACAMRNLVLNEPALPDQTVRTTRSVQTFTCLPPTHLATKHLQVCRSASSQPAWSRSTSTDGRYGSLTVPAKR